MIRTDPISVDVHRDARTSLAACDDFLRSDPVQHNVVWSLLARTSDTARPGTFVTLRRAGKIIGVAVQLEPYRDLTHTPMSPEAAGALAESLATRGIAIPGVMGATESATVFADTWSHRVDKTSLPVRAERILMATGVEASQERAGQLRVATSDDLATVEAWLRASSIETGEMICDPLATATAAVAKEQCFLWDNHGPVTMAFATPDLGGVTRIKSVYTPPQHRRNRYAALNVGAICSRALTMGITPMLYVDVTNTAANAMYTRLSFAVVGDVVRYRFASLPAHPGGACISAAG